ncbi:DUF3425 domain-containing protein [Aspergillus lucknowensis]|uniref:Uncharacterized protein n=1 Tax=Aspergillus lucknowensis TaxID=176173 RepID=A0ABR4LHT5_9EURO
MDGNQFSQIDKLQDKCRRLEFENRRLRRTLRCVDCNARIFSAAAKSPVAAPGKAGTRRDQQYGPTPRNGRALSPSNAKIKKMEGVSPSQRDSSNPFSSRAPPGFLLSPERGNLISNPPSPLETTLGDLCASAMNPIEEITNDPLLSWAIPVENTQDSPSSTEFLKPWYIPADDSSSDQLSILFNLQGVTHLTPDISPLPQAPSVSPNPKPPEGQKAAQRHYVRSFAIPPGLDLPEATLALTSGLGFYMGEAQQRMDRYIMALGVSIKQAFGMENTPSRALESLVSYGVLWIVREAWPAAEGFWKLTASLNGFVQSELWRLFPCRASYDKLHPAYRPTPLQLTVPHSPLIDWLPWPDLRDRIIEVQDQIDVETVCKTAIQNVMAHRHLAPTHEGEVYPPSFRVWDLYLLEKQSGLGLTNNQLSYKPRSPAVLEIENRYNLEYDDFTTQKLHPAFFEKYPFLACERIKTKFYAQDVPLVGYEDVGYPKPFTEMAMVQLRQLATTRVHRPDT